MFSMPGRNNSGSFIRWKRKYGEKKPTREKEQAHRPMMFLLNDKSENAEVGELYRSGGQDLPVESILKGTFDQGQGTRILGF